MNVERVFRILWGPTLENALDFSWPTVGSSPTFSRAPRAGSSMVSNGAASLSVVTGRYFRLKVTAQYFGGPHNFGATGLQAFIDWAADSNPFTLMPNIALPTLTVTGCYLQGPFTELSPTLEGDSTQSLDLTILHPTVDLGIAWRGLFFEYVAGQSLSDPTRAIYSRGSVGYETTPLGYLLSHPVGSICDGHYPYGIGGSGLQTTLLRQAVVNDVTNPEDLSNASWDKTNNVTVTANNAKAPDQAISADLVVETVTNGIHCISSSAITIASGDVQTALVFVRDGGRYKGVVYFGDGTGAAGLNRFGVSYDLFANTLVTNNLGAGTLAASALVPLAGGWFMIWIRGAINGGATTSFLNLRMFDNTGAGSYAGDAASGTYYWGATAVHTAAKIVASYTPTSSSLDKLQYAYGQTPQSQWWYGKYVEWGTGFVPGNPRFFELSSSGFAPPCIVLSCASDRWNITLHQASGDVSGTLGTGPTIGDTVELLVLLYSDGSVELKQSINGGAETTTGRSSAPAGGMPSAWNAGTKITFGDDGSAAGTQASALALNALRHGPMVTSGPAVVTTIAAARFA